MTYIYDILLNFIDGSRVYEFFEWEKQDMVEHIKRIPLFCVDDEVLEDALTKDIVFSKNFLQEIYNKTLVFGSDLENIISYAFLLSNCKRCYAFELDDKGSIICRSSLLLDEEEEILDVCHSVDIYEIKYEKKNKSKDSCLLTRCEEKKKNFIKRDLIYTYQNKEFTKLDYLYTECFGNDDSTYKEKFDKLMFSINDMNSLSRKRLNFILNLANNKNKILK